MLGSMRKQGAAIALLALLAMAASPVCFASGDDEAPAAGAIPAVREGAEEYVFQAEVNRLMDIIIHSLYSNKDIFLRELISNAADALDKIRFLALSDTSLLGEGDAAKLEIQISLDKERNILEIRDRGIGMTRDDLLKNLGTIAKSGTSAFIEQAQKGGDINLIGQFGVGFYSVYLVADYVEVVSKHNDDVQYIWSSTANGSFNIVEDTENAPLDRGTLIKIHLKEEALEYAQEWKLKELVHKYSEFMNFPIYLREEKEVDVPIEEEADEYEEVAEDGAAEGDDGVEDDTDAGDDDEDEAPKTRKEKQMVWELVNDNKAIWLRSAKDVSAEEYEKFYTVIAKAFDKPLAYSHFKAEGDVEFKSLLYIPSTAPHDFYDKYYEKREGQSIKLFVRRVFISDDVTELLPKWLSFTKGIVDSDTLPLQVSRELLQQSAALKTIKKKLVRKVLDLIKRMADDEVLCADEETPEDERPSEVDCGKFKKFYDAFGRALKLGVIEDSTNRGRLAKLLRFHTSKSGDALISLDEYVARMKNGQKDIYFLAGKSVGELAKSPFVEKLLKKDYEVVYFTDVLDEYVVQHMMDYDDKKLSDASKDGMKMTDKDEKEKKRDKELKAEFKDLTAWWKTAVGDASMSSVKVSNRLDTTPCVVVASKYGQSANMERISKAQAFRDDKAGMMGGSQKVLEINPRHPLIRTLKERVDADADSESTKTLAKLLWETALLDSGFAMEDTKSFSQRVYDLVAGTISVEGDLTVEAEEEGDDAAEEEDAAAEYEHDEL